MKKETKIQKNWDALGKIITGNKLPKEPIACKIIAKERGGILFTSILDGK
jgi:hypothetical protein